MAHVRAIFLSDFRDELGRVTVPTLVLSGDDMGEVVMTDEGLRIELVDLLAQCHALARAMGLAKLARRQLLMRKLGLDRLLFIPAATPISSARTCRAPTSRART